MARLRERDQPLTERTKFQPAAELLGGTHVLKRIPTDDLELHELLLQGLPGKALQHLIKSLLVLKINDSVERALGMSLRTLQRHKAGPGKKLSPEQSGRLWKFAEVLAKAIDVFVAQDEAEQWLERPAIGLNQHRPIDLLATQAGIELVETYLMRIKYGVYT